MDLSICLPCIPQRPHPKCERARSHPIFPRLLVALSHSWSYPCRPILFRFLWFVDVGFNTSGLFSFGRELQRRSGAITSHRLTSAVSVGGKKKLRREKKFPVCSYRNNQPTRQYQSDMAPDKKDMKRKGIILTPFKHIVYFYLMHVLTMNSCGRRRQRRTREKDQEGRIPTQPDPQRRLETHPERQEEGGRC